jgi:hypothetical protein
MASRTGKRGASEHLIKEMEKDGELLPETMVLALQDGEVRLFIAMFRRITGVPNKLVMKMLFDPDGTGLAIACKAASLGKSTFSSIFACSRKARSGADKGLRRDIRNLLGLYDRVSQEAAKKVVGRWRRNIGYRDAIRELELS